MTTIGTELSIQSLCDRHLAYLAQRHFSPSTLTVRRIRLGMFAKWCAASGVLTPAEINRSVVGQYQRYLFIYRKRNGEPLCATTQNARLIALRVWLKWMVRQGIFAHDPADDIEFLRLPHRLPNVLSNSEAETILKGIHVRNGVCDLRDRAILETLYSTGLRRSELVRLALNDLDTKRGVLVVKCGKGGRDRVVPIGNRCLRWIRRYLKSARPRFASVASGDTLFVTRRGKPFSPNHLTGLVRRRVKAGKTGKTGACHLFRHTAATLMLEGGADTRYIQQMLGHARLDTTQIYTHVSIAALKAVHSKTHPAP